SALAVFVAGRAGGEVCARAAKLAVASQTARGGLGASRQRLALPVHVCPGAHAANAADIAGSIAAHAVYARAALAFVARGAGAAEVYALAFLATRTRDALLVLYAALGAVVVWAAQVRPAR